MGVIIILRETNLFFDLPFCAPAHVTEKKEALGEVMNGDRLVSAPYKLDFILQHFEIFYNNDRVNALVDITEDKEVDVDFMYSVKWKETTTPFVKRMEKYSVFIIATSLGNPLVLNYQLLYAHDEEAADDQEETGWKYIHGNVYRVPEVQIFTGCSTWTIFIFVLALVSVFYPYNRGALFTALVVIYALTSGIAGYTASSFYCQLEGTNWVCFHDSNTSSFH
ncbi:hypothetical protein RND71_008161 [Anisodus tanguticus]|uniref:Transmembrane 9 superfamily member n=1 Tax=Anisodus tanguticus TaxID=243964 RepID=A0AAE1SMW8_9SOLA|nr:hypothetical protein RND71_008161 [Anisodus tanguticus]